ncbi:precorrin-6y C5,15-methyltransferase (decarboxylating) subunit CbiE [Clostridium weizhouense]|uniref:Precorrin-6y C5,15-methyltransferase (Decarboxylating) subunit CbiE n=1 Tax=Clostridium weizhouense TaxID=2859781 RepID=A0ABS7AKR5_9CLOT|nr:precorrin-6y C5,15-methyltransferase (decarboxylating) subunit CbiE [Clostridium weizhouense]MBW6409233.1 precorrin-6y C5,15-methyltransferase (decarboxylating) subunit CbiE [Clostridium weizhouense]
MLYIVGLGPGHRDYMLNKAINILETSDVIVGFKRALDSLDFINKKKIYLKSLSDIDKILVSTEEKVVSIVASGDPTFYGITNYIKSSITENFEIIPGISSFQYLTSKIKLPWNEAYLGSLHGRDEEFLKVVNENNITIWLTDKKNNPQKLCDILNNASINCKVIIGENLSYGDERIIEGKPEKFINQSFSDLSILIIIRKKR